MGDFDRYLFPHVYIENKNLFKKTKFWKNSFRRNSLSNNIACRCNNYYTIKMIQEESGWALQSGTYKEW